MFGDGYPPTDTRIILSIALRSHSNCQTVSPQTDTVDNKYTRSNLDA